MQFKLTKKDHENLKFLAKSLRRPMGDLIRESLTRMFDGKVEVTRGEDMTAAGVTLTQEQQIQLTNLSKETGVTMQELVQTAIRQLLIDMKDILESARALQERRDRHMRRLEALMKRQEALMKRQEKPANEDQTPYAVGAVSLKRVKKDENHH